MRDDTESLDVGVAAEPVTADLFAWEVDRFQAIVGNPAVPIAEKALAWYGIVSVASRLDSTEIGFARAGVALKHALCLWLEVRSDLGSRRRNAA